MKKSRKILAIGLSCAIAFSLAACGDDNRGSSTPGPNPDSVKTEQVSSTEWSDAFELADINNATVKATFRNTVSGVTDETYQLYKFDGSKIYQEVYDYEWDDSSTTAMPQKTTTKSYYSIEGDEVYYYTYVQSHKEWDKRKVTDSVSDNLTVSGLFEETFDATADAFANAFDSFTYTASQNAYVATDAESLGLDSYRGDLKSVSVKIANGKLSVLQLNLEDTHNGVTVTGSMIYQVYDHGKTSVTLPKIGGSGSGSTEGTVTPGARNQVDEAQWNAALSARAFSNVTVSNTITGEYNSTMLYKYDDVNRRVYMKEVLRENLLARIDDEYHIYYNEGNGWIYNGISEDGFEGALEEMISVLGVFKYSAFTYDNGVYTVENYSAEGMNGAVADVSMRFDDGRLMECEISMSMMGMSQNIVMLFSDYDNTTVELPSDLPDHSGGSSGGGDVEYVRMTEKDWRYAFRQETFYNCEVQASVYYPDSMSDGASVTMLADYNNERFYMRGAINDETSGFQQVEQIVAREGDIYNYYYCQNGGDWEINTTEDGSILSTYFAMCYSAFEPFLNGYSRFKYDEKTDKYYAYNYEYSTEAGDIILDSVSIRFANGRVAEIIMEMRQDDELIQQTITVGGYGSTDVWIPDVA